MIVSPSTNVYLFLGTIVGWAVLSPLAKLNGWAPGPVRNWNSGSQGWIIWVGIGLVIGESVVELGWMVVEPLFSRLSNHLAAQTNGQIRRQNLEERVSLLAPRIEQPLEHMDDPWPRKSLFTKFMALFLIPIVFIACAVSIVVVFDQNVQVSAVLVSLILVPLACVVSIRSLGQVESANTLAISKFHILVGFLDSL